VKALLLAAVLAVPAAAALPDRPASGRVLDQTGSISESGRARIQAVSDELESRTGAELAVAVVQTLDGMDPADYANRLFKAWGVGKKGQDNGVLILVSPADRKSRIEVGYGLEAKLPDIVAGRLLKDELRPYFQDGRFEDGVLFGARRIDEIVSGSPASGEAPPRPRPQSSNNASPWFLIPFLAIFVVLGASAVGAALGARNAASFFLLIWGGLFGGIPMFMAYAAMKGGGFSFLAAVWAASALAGFRYGSKHPDAFKSSGRGGSTGGWSSGGSDFGGGWSGGDSGGGSDFGGGSSGGGGASDSW
jgi:uncharacterized protein